MDGSPDRRPKTLSVVVALAGGIGVVAVLIGLVSTFKVVDDPGATAPGTTYHPTVTMPHRTTTARPGTRPPATTPVTTTPVLATTVTTTFSLQDGKVVYRAPSPMRVNDVQRVTVRVAGRDVPPDLTSGLPGTGRITTGPAKVGASLSADLSNPDFQITRVGSDDGKRELPDGGYAEWAWDVRPQKSGKFQLDFVLFVAKESGGVPIHYRTYAHEVEVEVNIGHGIGKFAKEYAIPAGVIVPAFGLVGGFFLWLRKKRKKRAVAEEAEEA